MGYPRFTQIASMVLITGLLAGQILAAETSKATADSSQVQGSACYRLGDDESLLSAQKKALALAREAALQKIKAFAESADRLGGRGLEHEVMAAASRVGLSNERITKQEVRAHQVCVWLSATPNSREVTELMRQRLNAKELAQKVQDPVIAQPAPSFIVKVWTNKKDEPFVEGERLIISVESEKDAYLKLDYYTAEGKVVHLVPNVFPDKERIRGGQTYAFGEEGGPLEFKISPPFGEETIKAIVSTVPFDSALTEPERTSEATVYLTKMQNAVKAKAKDATWSEGKVAIYTANRDDLQVAKDRKQIDLPTAKVGTRSVGPPPQKPEQPIDIIGVPGRKKAERPIETMGTMGRSKSGDEKNP
ncbi:MAG TPA: DUF4384 domain-containing protein [Nitrospirales bacterium]